MGKKKRSGMDRRSGEERREVYDLDYFLEGGSERRQFVDRRGDEELREGWVRVNKWASMELPHDPDVPSEKP